MAQSYVHLIAFALVAVFCVSMVTSVSDSIETPEEQTIMSNSVSGNESDHGDSSKVNTSTQPDENTFITSPTTNTTYPHITNITHTDEPNKLTHNEDSEWKPNTRFTSLELTTPEFTTITAAPSIKSIILGSPATTPTPTGSQSGSGGKGAGIFFLTIIIFIIITLAVILYILWKKGKRYSFDLTTGEHDTPLRGIDETGTFEQTKGSNMNLDYIQEDNPNKTSPVVNGCSGEMPDQTSCSEQQNVPEEDSFASNMSLSSPVKKVEFNLDLDLIGGEPDLLKQATDDPTDNGNDNENNNNDMNTGNTSADLFTEINLDDMQ